MNKPQQNNPSDQLVGIIAIAVVLIGAFYLIRYLIGSSGTVVSNSQSSPAYSSTNLQDQAIAEVQRIYESTSFTRCGDSYYSVDNLLDNGGIAQRKNPTYVVLETYPITESDQLNNIVWSGKITLQYTARRRYVNNAWTDWQPYESLSMYSLDIQKRDSDWRTGSTYLLNDLIRKINCSQVPK